MPPPPQLIPSWTEALADEWHKPYLVTLAHFLAQEREEATVYPLQEEVFAAFNQTPFEEVRVVIVGQDPYHGAGQAHGLSFSVPRTVRPPPSLQNIFKELQRDLGVAPPQVGDLTKWAKQGVLLLNATLTVRAGAPRSHYGKGWERFTDEVIQKLNQRADPIIFVLWGKAAQEKCALLAPHHPVLTAPHPSPYSAHTGFLGCGHFSKIQQLLIQQKRNPIDWSL